MIEKCEKVIGLDISDSSVKLVCLGGNNALDSFAIVELIPGATDQDIVMAIKKGIGEGCRGGEVNVGLRGTDVLTKILTLRADNAEQLSALVEEEVKDLLPVERNEVELSWDVISAGGGEVKLLLIIVPKEVLLRYQRVIEGAGLKVKNFEINAYTLKRSFGKMAQGKVMLIDVHSDETDIEVYHDNVLLVDRTVDFGGRKITQLLAHLLNINVEEAENFKRQNKVDDNQFEKTYRPVAVSLADEIKRTLVMAQLEFDFYPDRILLTGGDFAQEKLGSHITELLGDKNDVVISGPEIEINQSIAISQAEKMRVVNAIGLAQK